MQETVFILSLIFLTYWSGYFSASEIALFSLSTPKIKSFEQDSDPRKKMIANLVLKPKDLLVTIFIMNTLVNILIQNVSSAMFGVTSSWFFKIALPLFLTLVFGEIIPKYIALQMNVAVAYNVSPVIDFLTRFLKPIREWAVKITTPISRGMFFFLKKEANISKEELQHVLKASQEFGVLHADEAELIRGYMNLQDSLVKELMRPREDILYYNIQEPLTKLTYLFVDQECTRIPVCDKGLESVLGIISADQFFINRLDLAEPEDVKKILKKPFYVPESTPARLLFRRFNTNQEVLALIVDEYGAISGLISREDLFEEVVGEISDLRDQNPLYTKASPDVIIANGKLELFEFETLFGIPLHSENNMLTIGGWLSEQLGDIPKTGATYETNDFFFQILAAEPNRVKSVYVRRKSSKNKNVSS